MASADGDVVSGLVEHYCSIMPSNGIVVLGHADSTDFYHYTCQVGFVFEKQKARFFKIQGY